jgi:hypothetical protein
MALRAEIYVKLRKELVTKIHGQPMDQDITTLSKRTLLNCSKHPFRTQGGNHGHAGIIVKAAKYLTMAGVAFTNPIHPGIYPSGLATNGAAGTQAREEAKHKV